MSLTKLCKLHINLVGIHEFQLVKYCVGNMCHRLIEYVVSIFFFLTKKYIIFIVLD
jgi:hypothetical protein